jgi:hypothetical protein
MAVVKHKPSTVTETCVYNSMLCWFLLLFTHRYFVCWELLLLLGKFVNVICGISASGK